MKKMKQANAALYGQGRRYAGAVARHAARGAGPRAALRRAAADLGLDVGTVRSAVAFKTAVDLVVGNAGTDARRLILGGHPRLPPRQVARLARTHPDRQRYEVDQVARGRPLFANPLPGVEPPFDTLNIGEVRSRLARFDGLLARVADGLSATPAGGWPSVAKLHAIGGRNAAIREASAALQTALKGCSTRAESARSPGQPPPRPRKRRPSARAAFDPGNAYALVSAARGVMAKNLRDGPRLLRDSPPTAEERASVLRVLRHLKATSARLSRIIREHVSTTTHQAIAVPPEGRVRVAAGDAGAARGVAVVDQPEGPADWDGTYIVTFRLDADAEGVVVGALGTFRFPAGFYCYVGSMFGPGGVRARTGRHRTRVKTNKKWNVDYLTPLAGAVEVWWTHDPVRRECSWSAALGASAAFDCPVLEFGARDCRKAPPLRIGGGVYRCPAHLDRSLLPPDVHDFAFRLGRLVPGHGVLYRQRLGQIGRPDPTVYPHDTPQGPTPSAGRGRT